MKNRLVILGAGESGVGAALLAKQKEFDLLSKVPARRLDFVDLLLEAF